METKIRADKLGLKGFVQNLEDGRIQVIIEGDKEKVDKLVNWLKRGPMFAKVTDIQVINENYTGEFKNFNILY